MDKSYDAFTLSRLASVFFLLFTALQANFQPVSDTGGDRGQSPNTLTPEESAAGWKLLFNGRDLEGWRTQNGSAAPTGWQVIDAALANTNSGSNNQVILSTEAFLNFELALEWKIAKAGDGGVFLRVWKEDEDLRHVSPQVQIIDNSANLYGAEPNTWAGACTHLYPPKQDMTRPIGEFNHFRLVVQGRRMEHWLNGVLVVEYQIGSEDWKARLARSALKAYPNLGSGERGYIGLQQLMGGNRYRSVKIRPLPDWTSIRLTDPAAPGFTRLEAARGAVTLGLISGFDAQGRRIRDAGDFYGLRWVAATRRVPTAGRRD